VLLHALLEEHLGRGLVAEVVVLRHELLRGSLGLGGADLLPHVHVVGLLGEHLGARLVAEVVVLLHELLRGGRGLIGTDLLPHIDRGLLLQHGAVGYLPTHAPSCQLSPSRSRPTTEAAHMIPQPPTRHFMSHSQGPLLKRAHASACDDSWPPPLVRQYCSCVRRSRTAEKRSVGCAELAGEQPRRNEGNYAREHVL
jgi:hypothetical protein